MQKHWFLLKLFRNYGNVFSDNVEINHKIMFHADTWSIPEGVILIEGLKAYQAQMQDNTHCCAEGICSCRSIHIRGDGVCQEGEDTGPCFGHATVPERGLRLSDLGVPSRIKIWRAELLPGCPFRLLL